MTTREQIIAAAKEAGAVLFESQGELIVHLGATRVPDMIEHLYAIAFEAGRQAEREECFSLKKDALEIFNFNQQETSQEVRDVTEWFSGAIRARGNSK